MSQGDVAFPTARLRAALILSALLFAAMTSMVVVTARSSALSHERSLRLYELRGVIVHLDEVLTMSARMAASTGDLAWEQRYHDFEPVLDAAIREAIRLSPAAYGGLAATTDTANRRMVAMENEAFAHVRAGRLDDARAILDGAAYAAEKRVLAEGMRLFIAGLNEALAESAERRRSDVTLATGGAVACAGLLLAAWILVARSLIRWRSALTNAEVALRTSESRTRAIVDGALDSIITIDARGRIVEFNPSAERTFGRRRADVLHEPLADVIIPERLRAQHARGLAHAVSSGSAALAGRRIETTGLRKDGSEIPVELTITPVSGDGGAFTAFLRDITDRKEAEREIHALHAELEQRIAARTAELRALASELVEAELRERHRLSRYLHDHVQQLLVAAKLHASTLRLMGTGNSSNIVGADFVRATAQSIDELLQQCTEASRSLAAEIAPPVLAEGLLPAVRWLADRQAQLSRLQVEVEVEGNIYADQDGGDDGGDDDVECESEPVRAFVFDAVRELLFNVVKHAHVNTARVTISREAEQHVRVTVADEGDGFIVGDADGASDKLGLSSIRHRAELLGGEVTVRSAPGAGCTVSLIVPRGRPSAPNGVAGGGAIVAAPARAPVADVALVVTAPPPATVRVLIVDDHEGYRRELAAALRQADGVELVGEAVDGERAVALALELAPDVVLMDARMPTLDGPEATRRILHERPQTRVIGLSMDEHGSDLLAAGAVKHVAKDAGIDAVLSSLGLTRPSGPR